MSIGRSARRTPIATELKLSSLFFLEMIFRRWLPINKPQAKELRMYPLVKHLEAHLLCLSKRGVFGYKKKKRKNTTEKTTPTHIPRPSR